MMGLSLAHDLGVVSDLPNKRIIRCSFGGLSLLGSEGNPMAGEMKRLVAEAVQDLCPAAVVFDLSDLEYSWGDAICQIVVPLMRKDGSFVPSAIVATGGTATALSPLLEPNFLLGLADSRLCPSCDEAVAYLGRELATQSV